MRKIRKTIIQIKREREKKTDRQAQRVKEE